MERSLKYSSSVQRNIPDGERWRRSASFQQTPLQMMHKAEKKYEVGKVRDEEEVKQRQLKAILNKLTPQNFERRLEQVKAINIDNVVTLFGATSQIFEEALMEPTFCEVYANFCFHLASELPDFSEDNKKITFKRLLVNMCQMEFERRESEVKADEGEVKQSAEEREESRDKARRRMLGNIRLIGELYKKRMLPEMIMHHCIRELLDPDEGDIEALCKLMSTIGEMIDHPKAKQYMDAYFERMKLLSNNINLSSSVRFMLKDAIDLRKNKWQLRRKVEGPKEIEEVHRDAAQERQAQAGRSADRNLDRLVATSEKIWPKERLRDMSLSAIREYYSARDEKELALCVKDLNSPSFHPSMVSLWVTDSFERKDTERDLLAKLLVNLVKSQGGTLSQVQLIKGFESVLSTLEDAVNDAPRAAEFLGRIFGKAIAESVVTLSEIWQLIHDGGEEPGSLLEVGLAADVLGSMLEVIQCKKGDNVLNEICSSSNLHQAEKKYKVGKVRDEEEVKQRQLKAILNKLTPQNFERLLEQVKAINIDNVVTLVGATSQIFEEALMEPTFCEVYANFCFHLASELPDFSEDNKKITFKRLLLNKCQEEFERRESEVKADEGKVKQSVEEREDRRDKARRRMLGNIRLIGELYKKRILTERIMHKCIRELVDPDEGDIEALCKLMSTIGEMIDHPEAKQYMDAYFERMKFLSNNINLSSSLRFMLKDAIDLRKNKWQQRRKVEGPNKIEEVHRDANLRDMSLSAIRENYSARDEKELALCVKDLNSPSFHPSMVSLWVTDSFERKDTERDLLAKLLVNLMKSQGGTLSQVQLIKGFESVLSTLEDAVNDAPRAAEFLGRIFAKAIVESVVTLSEIGQLIHDGGEEPGSLLEVGLAADVLRSMLEVIQSEKGDNVLNEICSSSNLHKAEKKYKVGKVRDEEEVKQRQLKAILNKLTPQNFERRLEQVKAINIDNVVTLFGATSQIFEEALMEPTFCEVYANFCFHLASELPDFSEDNKKITFKRLLINMCQMEFERRESEVKADEGEVKQSAEEREESRDKARRRMLGNIRLIGELYKKRMLTERIMHHCIRELLDPDEGDIEALCKLMSTIGEMIDHPEAKQYMDAYFERMKLLSNNINLSSSVRFMLKDAIDLRKNKWQQRRKGEGPNKIKEVHRDSAQERQAQTGTSAHRDPGSI